MRSATQPNLPRILETFVNSPFKDEQIKIGEISYLTDMTAIAANLFFRQNPLKDALKIEKPLKDALKTDKPLKDALKPEKPLKDALKTNEPLRMLSKHIIN